MEPGTTPDHGVHSLRTENQHGVLQEHQSPCSIRSMRLSRAESASVTDLGDVILSRHEASQNYHRIKRLPNSQVTRITELYD